MCASDSEIMIVLYKSQIIVMNYRMKILVIEDNSKIMGFSRSIVILLENHDMQNNLNRCNKTEHIL